mmetsp:Transcript_47651/g.113427  ORF Transcript_47651/g.113427 Transcript_47651/m.113427 type:complete len:747 (+) Transcript_47651:60-2300(+)
MNTTGASVLQGLRVPLADSRAAAARKRQQMLCSILVLVVALATAVVVFFERGEKITSEVDGAFKSSGSGGPADDVPASQLAAKLAARHFPDQVLNSMDLTADPCGDFYQFACGTFLDVTQVEEDQNEWALSWSGVSGRNSELLREVVETDKGLAGDFYRSCLNMTRINQLGTAPLQPFLEAVETLRGCSEAAKLPFAKVHKRTCGIETLVPLVVKWQMIDIKVLFDWSIEVNPHDPTQYAVSLMQDGITLPDPKWYYSGTPDANLKLKGLEDVATQVFKLCGEDEATALENAHHAVAFETELAKIFRSEAHEDQQEQTVFTLAQADVLAPNLGLSRVLKALAGEFDHLLTDAKVLIRNPAYFAKCSKLLLTTPASHLRAYMRFRVAFILGADLSEEFLDIGQVLQKVVVGQESRVPRWYKCFKSVSNALPDYVGKVFVQRYFSMDILTQAQEMLHRIRDQFQDDLLTVPWMQERTRSEATYKLGGMFFSVGFPPSWADYTSLKLKGDFVDDGDRLYKWYIHHAFARLARPVERTRWGTVSPALVDAFYSYDKNGIFVPAGILQKPFFSTTYRDARNYGAIGTILGHEMTHGFDNQGRRFNPEGRLGQWWSAEDRTAFKDRAQCIEKLYSTFEVDGHKVNGELTLAENIADIGGVKLAYRAMERLMQEKEGNGAPTTTDRQLFFVAQAQNWCSKERPAAAALQILTDAHSPDKWRVNGPLSQVKEFSEVFQCPVGAKMNPPQRCHVW